MSTSSPPPPASRSLPRSPSMVFAEPSPNSVSLRREPSSDSIETKVSPKASPVLPGRVAEVDEHPGPRLGVAGGVDAVAAVDHVGAGTAVEEVVARVALQGVVAALAEEQVGRAAADQEVVAGPGDDQVAVEVAAQHVVESAADQALDAVVGVAGRFAGVDRRVGEVRGDARTRGPVGGEVAAAAAAEDVGAPAALEDVVAAAAGQACRRRRGRPSRCRDGSPSGRLPSACP